MGERTHAPSTVHGPLTVKYAEACVGIGGGEGEGGGGGDGDGGGGGDGDGGGGGDGEGGGGGAVVHMYLWQQSSYVVPSSTWWVPDGQLPP